MHLLTPKRREQVLQFQCGFRKFTSHRRHIQGAVNGNSFTFKEFMADGPVSRILCGTPSVERTTCRGDHSSRSRLTA